MKPEMDAGSRKLMELKFEWSACVSTGTSGRVGAGAEVEQFELLHPLVLVHLFLMFTDAEQGGLAFDLDLQVRGAILKESWVIIMKENGDKWVGLKFEISKFEIILPFLTVNKINGVNDS